MSWLIDTLIATGALIALVLVVRRPVARWFGPGMAYALWALPLLRLVLPPLVLPARPAPVDMTVTAASVELAAPLPGSAPEAATVFPFAEVALALWLAGGLGFLIWRTWSYRRMRRQLLADARPVGEAGAVRLIESPAVASPVAFGLHDKVIALPQGFMAQSDLAGRDLAIAHELEHHAGRDIAVNFAMQPLLALHWFNPIAWLGWRALRRDQEAACDARVLAGRCAETRAAYARLIAQFAQNQRLPLAAPLACPVVGEKSIVHRLRSLTMTEPSPVRRRFGRLLLGAAALALPLTASITYAASEPATPAPPEAPVALKAPTAPEAPQVHVDKRVVIIRHDGGKDGDHGGHGGKDRKIVIIDNPAGSTIDDKALHTRVIERDGRTIVLKTSKPISDKEAEERAAKAMASMAEADAMAIVTGDDSPDGDKVSHEIHTVMLSRAGGEWTGKGDHAAHIALACSGGHVSEANATIDKDGKKHIARVKICSKGGDMARALSGLRQARDKIAADSKLSGEIREEILRELDAEIARLSKEG
jgi:bla regulator protein blaR1